MRYILKTEENYELEDKLQEILEEKNIDFDFDNELRLVVPNDKYKKVEIIMKSLKIEYEIYEGYDNSYERYLLHTNDEMLEELEILLDKKRIDYDYDAGDRIMIPTIDCVEAENIFVSLGIDYDLI